MVADTDSWNMLQCVIRDCVLELYFVFLRIISRLLRNTKLDDTQNSGLQLNFNALCVYCNWPSRQSLYAHVLCIVIW